MIYMICYDVANPKRLKRVAKALEQNGIRVQKSFFQCEMEKQKLLQLKGDLLKIIDRRKDSLFFYPLCEKCSKGALTDGKGEVIKINPFTII